MKLMGITVMLIVILLAPIGVSALEQSEVNNTTVWAVAGGGPVPISIFINNNSLKNYFRNVTVSLEFVATEPDYGQLTYHSVVLTNKGYANFTFTPNTLKGDASLIIKVYFDGEEIYSDPQPLIQKIDHAEPKYYSQLSYQKHETVNLPVEITAQIIDDFGNPVDNKYERDQNLPKQTIKYTTSSTTDGGFGEVREKLNISIIDDNGFANIKYYLSKYIGNNLILATAPTTVNPNPQWISIRGTADNATEFSSYITSDIELVDSGIQEHIALPNGIDIFRIYYNVKDQYQNPIGNITIHWQSMINGMIVIDRDFITNNLGYVYFEYGPSSKIETIDITAIVEEFPPVIDTLKFKPTGKELFSIRANPQIIASKNTSTVNPISYTTIEAILLDAAGNGISNETIIFKITDEGSLNGTIIQNSSFLEGSPEPTASAETNSYGVASVSFFAAEFPQRGDDGYTYDARGFAEITATWNDNSVKTNVEFKSYPFIRSEVSVPTEVKVNSSFDVTISLIGDGYIPRKPVDVLFVNSRGPSMLQGLPDPLIYTRSAGNIILDYLSIGPDLKKDDRAGLWTFSDKGYSDLAKCTKNWMSMVGDDSGSCKIDEPGYQDFVEGNYPGSPNNFLDYATCESGNFTNAALDTNKQSIRDAMNEIIPWEDGQSVVHASPLRYALYKSITDLSNPDTGGRPANKVVRAIVVLIDDNYKWFGTPLADSGSGYDWDENAIKDPGPGENWAKFPPSPSGTYSGKWAESNTLTSWQNMSNYADDNNIRIYIVGYATGFSESIKKKYNILCDSTDGFFREAPSIDELYKVYEDIAEDLMVPASVNTEMDIDFASITWSDIEGNSHTEPGKNRFTYEPIPRSSTNVDSWWINPLDHIDDLLPVEPYGPYPNSTDMNQPCDSGICTKYDYWFNQSSQWNDDNVLRFYVGNISVGQKWIGKFTLNATYTGFFNLINGSDPCPIKYTSEESKDACDPYCCIPLPNAKIHVTGEGPQNPIIPTPIVIECLPPLNIGSENMVNITDIVDIPWGLKYDGSGTITQKIYLMYASNRAILDSAICDDANWIEYSRYKLPGHGPYDIVNSTPIDFTNRYGFFKVSIRAEEIIYPKGVGHTPCIVCPYTIHNINRGEIKIE